MIAIGIGANSRATQQHVIDALARFISMLSARADVLATFTEAPFIDLVEAAARARNMNFSTAPLAELRARGSECKSLSARSYASLGVPSIAEAAALAAAGDGSRLVIARVVCGPITAAAAQSAETSETTR